MYISLSLYIEDMRTHACAHYSLSTYLSLYTHINNTYALRTILSLYVYICLSLCLCIYAAVPEEKERAAEHLSEENFNKEKPMEWDASRPVTAALIYTEAFSLNAAGHSHIR